MILIFDTQDKALFQEKVDVDFYLEMDPLMDKIYDILIDALCYSTTFKAGHLFKMAFAICAYIMKNRHPEERIAEMIELLDNMSNEEIRSLILATVWVLLSLYRSPDKRTDDKIRRITNLMERALEDNDSRQVKHLVYLANEYVDTRKYANLDFISHEGLIIESDAPPKVSIGNRNNEKLLECAEKAKRRLQIFSGISPKALTSFMEQDEFNNLVNYVKHFVIFGKIPNDIQKINARVNNKMFISYTFHCIFEDLQGSKANHKADEWVGLMFAIFSNFDSVLPQTFISKFSEKPKDYDETVATIEKSLTETTKNRAG